MARWHARCFPLESSSKPVGHFLRIAQSLAATRHILQHVLLILMLCHSATIHLQGDAAQQLQMVQVLDCGDAVATKLKLLEKCLGFQILYLWREQGGIA